MKSVKNFIVFICAGLLFFTGGQTARAAFSTLYTGVNLSGAEFGMQNLPGTYNTDYTYPTRGEVDYFAAKGMNTFRLAFRWERLQPTRYAAFNAAEQARIDDFVNYATAKGAFVILNPHNFARYYGEVIGQGVPADAFADLWAKLAERYKGNNRVIFGLMNEPHDMPSELWRDDANAAIAAIRRTGAANLILVPGNAYTGAWSWTNSYYGTPNASVMLSITDPINNYAFEVHQYLDSDYSGTRDTCVSPTFGSEKLAAFTGWLKQNGKRGFLGEFAGGRNDTCYAALDDMLTYIDKNSDVWLGWTYWSAGPWWSEYIFTLEPTGCPGSCIDRPQMARLLPHVRGATARKPFDFNGDGKADISLYRPTDRVWYVANSGGGISYNQFGLSTDRIVPADYDGDGKTDIAVYRPATGVWFIMKSSGGFQFVQFGIAEDIPQPGDFNGDGRAEIAVFRPSTGVWFILSSDITQSTATQFGASEDKPVAADYDGDGKAEIAVYRPSLGVWFFYNQATRQTNATRFGIAADKPVAADYDGDGRTDIAVYRPADGNWYILGTMSGYTVTRFGLATDQPTPADFDGDGKTDIAVYRPNEGNWYQLRSRDGFSITRFGLDTDKPTPNAFVY